MIASVSTGIVALRAAFAMITMAVVQIPFGLLPDAGVAIHPVRWAVLPAMLLGGLAQFLLGLDLRYGPFDGRRGEP